LQVENLLHLFKELFFTIVFAPDPLSTCYLASGDGFTEGDRVDKVVFEYSRMSAYARDVVSIILLTEVSKLVRYVKISEFVPA